MYYVLEIYPKQPMRQLCGMTHPDGHIHTFTYSYDMMVFLLNTPNTRKITANEADILKLLNIGVYLS